MRRRHFLLVFHDLPRLKRMRDETDGGSMRQMLRAAAYMLMVGVMLAPAHAANGSYRARHPYPHAYRDRAHGVWRWVEFPGTPYAPISPMDYSVPNSEYFARSLAPWPTCCPFPTYSPVYFP
jgi:hypothetical protein